MPGTIKCKPMQAIFKVEDEDKSPFKPYCKLKVGRDSMESSIVEEKDMQAEWTDSLKVKINPDEKKAKFVIKNDKKGIRSTIGKSEIDLEQLKSSKNMIQWFYLSRRGKITGEVLVDLEYIPDSDSSSS